MSFRLFEVSHPRNASTGVVGATLSAEKQIALALCAQIGVGESARAAKGQASRMMMELALDAQSIAAKSFKDGECSDESERDALRDEVWRGYKDGVIRELHDAAIAQYASNLGLHNNVKAVKVGTNKVIGIDALLAKSSNLATQYISNIESCWRAGLSIKADTKTDGEMLPESMSSMLKRKQDAVEQADVARSDGRRAAKAANEFASAVQAGVVGTEAAPRICIPAIAESLLRMLPNLSLLVLKAQAQDVGALKSLQEIECVIAACASDASEQEQASEEDSEQVELPELAPEDIGERVAA